MYCKSIIKTFVNVYKYLQAFKLFSTVNKYKKNYDAFTIIQPNYQKIGCTIIS